MITITRRTARSLRAVFRRAFGSSRTNNPTLTFEASPHGLTVWGMHQSVVLKNQIPGEFELESARIPLNALAECEAANDQPVEIEAMNTGEPDPTAVMRWDDGGIPQVVELEAQAPADACPAIPDNMKSASTDLLAALRDASETTDASSSRYALDCIQLMGSSGRISGTDGKQLLVVSGFEFPWDEDLLIPGNAVFGHRDLLAATEVSIGRLDEWIVIQAGTWTIFTQIATDGRFPDAMSYIPNRNEAQSTVTIADEDADFLVKSIKRLPSDDDHHEPVTFDVNGRVVVRAQADGRQPTELVLTNSSMDGSATRINTNRRFIARAAKLGLRRVNLYGPDRPAHGCSDTRDYIWIPLTKDGIVEPTDGCIRIESPAANGTQSRSRQPQPQPTRPPRKERSTTMTRSTQTRSTTTAATASTPTDAAGLDAMIESAEAVRTSLREAATTVSRLIAELKRHRKQSKTIRTALSSLRELEAIGA